MAQNAYTGWYDSLPKLVKIIVQILLGWIVGGIYRILRFLETKNVVTLVVGILGIIPGIDVVMWIVDLVTVIMNDKITVLAD